MMADMPLAPDAQQQEPVNILLVDDRPENLLALEAVLEDLGQNLVRATSGKEALKCVLRQEFAVILLDVQMPEMDGFETAELIRQRGRSGTTPIIFLTAYDRAHAPIARGYALGAVDYLFKPIVPEILRAKVVVFIELYKKTAQVQRLLGEDLRQRTVELEAANRQLEQDIAERKRTEARLQRLTLELERSNRELLDFATAASHDLQEPLRKIQTFGDRLQATAGGTLGAESRQYLARMQDAAARMRVLIDDLLAHSRVTTKARPFVTVDLREVAAGVLSDCELAIEQAGARVELGALPAIEADRSQMHQLLQNLVCNALKFHRRDLAPVINVYAELLPGRPHATDTGERCRIVVADNGIGFDEKYAERIFAIFERLHSSGEYQGTGIGLAICRKIVERHGGTITAHSKPGQGASFVVTLPVKQAKEATSV